MLTVGTEWLIEASGCDAEALRDVERLRDVFARAVRELDAGVPLAVITGWGEAVGSDKLRATQVDWVVTKPFNADRISELAREISLTRHRAREESMGLTFAA